MVGWSCIGLGIALLLIESIHCAFENTGCRAGRLLLLPGAVLFVFAGAIAMRSVSVWAGAMIAVVGIVTAVCMAVYWATSGKALVAAAIPMVVATGWLVVRYQNERRASALPVRPDT